MNRNKQNGFSIVELMVTLVINSIVLIAVVELFTQNRGHYQEQDSLARMQENGRFAMQYITRDIRYADFWGCMPDQQPQIDPNTGMTIPSTGMTNNVANTYGGIMNIFNNGGLSGQDATGPAAPDANFNLAADQFSVTRSSNVAAPLVVDMSDATDVITVGVNPNLNPGDMLTLSDCYRGDIFVVTGVNQLDIDVDGDDEWQISHAPTLIDGTQVNNSNQLSYDYKLENSPFLYSRASGVTYRIGPDPANNNEPSLLRNNQVLVSGVETMQILYGEDTNGDAAADRYIAAGGGLNFNNVVSVRIALLVRSDRAINTQPVNYTFPVVGTVTPNDNRSRRVYTATIAIRNRTQGTTLPPPI